MHRTFVQFVSLGFSLSLLGCSLDVVETTGESADALTEDALPVCIAQPACAGPSSPTLGKKRSWKNFLSSWITLFGEPNHRGRDQIFVEGHPQTLIGKFAYGLFDKDLKGEEVDIFVERGCSGAWEKLGTAVTTNDGQLPTVNGIEDDGGRIYFSIPANRTLGIGRHRVRMVVAGDHSFADLVVDVVPPGTTYFVSDVDGTLTTHETEEWTSLLTGSQSNARPYAARSLASLAAKGIRPLYLTARPEWLKNRTREFLAAEGFPPGIIHTTQDVLPALGSGASNYKGDLLTRYQSLGIEFAWSFGNTSTDGDAYERASIEPLDRRIFVQFDDAHGGRRIENYREVLDDTAATAAVCK